MRPIVRTGILHPPVRIDIRLRVIVSFRRIMILPIPVMIVEHLFLLIKKALFGACSKKEAPASGGHLLLSLFCYSPELLPPADEASAPEEAELSVFHGSSPPSGVDGRSLSSIPVLSMIV